MKKTDAILIAVLAILAVVSYVVFGQITNSSAAVDGTAIVYYNDSKILEIYLEDGTYDIIDDSRIIEIDEENFIYKVEGSNPYGVTIEYANNQVRVIDEESPKHICQTQGWSNSPLSPITCLPNNIIILIEADTSDDPIDDITG